MVADSRGFPQASLLNRNCYSAHKLSAIRECHHSRMQRSGSPAEIEVMRWIRGWKIFFNSRTMEVPMRRTFNAFMIVSVWFALLVSFSGMVYAQVSGRIIVVGVPDKFKSSNGNESTYGLKTVGVGARVVLKPYVLSGTGTRYSDSLVTATGATWTVTGPKGAVTVSDTAAGVSRKG